MVDPVGKSIIPKLKKLSGKVLKSVTQVDWHVRAANTTSRLGRERVRRTENTVHALKTRLEFVEREYVQAKDVQAALLLLTDKLQNQLLDKLLVTLLGTVTKLTNSLDARYGDPELSCPDNVEHVLTSAEFWSQSLPSVK